MGGLFKCCVTAAFLLTSACREAPPAGFGAACGEPGEDTSVDECLGELECFDTVTSSTGQCTLTCESDRDCPADPGAWTAACYAGRCEIPQETL